MYIWKDRKRILGMPISFTVYALSEDRLFVKTGLLNLRTEEILLYRIRDIGMHRSLGQRMLGVGSIDVASSDKTRPQLEIRNIRNAEKVKEMLHDAVEKMKIERRLRVNELIGDDDFLGEESDA